MTLFENPIFGVLLRIVIASAFIVAVYFITKYLSRFLEKAMSSIDRRVRKEIEEVIKYIIYVVAALIAVAIISPEESILTTLLLLVGLALIVSFSDSLRNWGAQYSTRSIGFLKIGDWVEVDGYYGRLVEETGSGVVLESPRREKIFVPNTRLASSIVINRTTQIGSIHIVAFSLPGDRNPVEAMEEMREAMSTIIPELASEPEITMEARKSEYYFEIAVEIMNAYKAQMIREEIVKKILEAFPEAKILET